MVNVSCVMSAASSGESPYFRGTKTRSAHTSQAGVPRPDLAFAASPDQVSVGGPAAPFSTGKLIEDLPARRRRLWVRLGDTVRSLDLPEACPDVGLAGTKCPQ